jgi:hypothetical protein
MSSEQSAGLAQTRLNQGPRVPAPTSVHAGAICIGKGMPGASFNLPWYRPNGLLSQGERLPS